MMLIIDFLVYYSVISGFLLLIALSVIAIMTMNGVGL